MPTPNSADLWYDTLAQEYVKTFPPPVTVPVRRGPHLVIRSVHDDRDRLHRVNITLPRGKIRWEKLRPTDHIHTDSVEECLPAMDTGADIINMVSSNDEEVADIILLTSDDTNLDTFSDLPLEFDSSNSSIGTLGSVDTTTLRMDAALPMLTDIAEETIYETEFFEETMKLEDDLMRRNDDAFVQEHNDISNILMETVTAESNEAIENDCFDSRPVNVQPMTRNELENGDDFLDSQVLETVGEGREHEQENGTFISTADVPTANTSISDISNLISISNNTNLVSGILENSGTLALNNRVAESAEKANNINIEFLASPKSAVYSNLSNVIHVNAIGGGNKISTLQPITVQNAPKLVPISLASSNALKRPAVISVGPSSANVLTKVLVAQGKSGQPIRILPNTMPNSSPVKTITAAQAKQMGIKLQPIRPSTTMTTTPKPFKQKFILSNISPGAPVLKKVQSLPKAATPTKILPAPLVSKSLTGSQTQKIILNSDYLMKTGAIIPKVSTGQMILSNLKSSPVVSNHTNSPKKQVQYIPIKLVGNIGSTNLPTVPTTKGRFTAVTQNSTITKMDKEASPIIVAAAPNFPATKLNIKTMNNSQASVAASTSSLTVLPVLPAAAVKSTPGQRLILPAVTKATDNVNHTVTVSEMKPTKSSTSGLLYLSDPVLQKIQTDLQSTTVKPKEEPQSMCETTAKISYDSQEISLESRSAKSPTRYTSSTPSPFETGSGLKSRKPCNCTRSQCLKLYCECFANGEFCNNCNCTSCHNNINHEENRQNAIRSCLDRNPQAFRPKIGKCLVGLSDRRHTKGCHCKRSGCLKNYCECYEAQIPCSDNCKCVGCKNIDDGLFSTSCSANNATSEKSDQGFEFQTLSKNKLTAEINDAVGRSGPVNPRHAFSFIKDQVVEATCQCLLAQAEDVKRRKVDIEDGKKYILEEFGRCLIQIIECAPEKYVSS